MRHVAAALAFGMAVAGAVVLLVTGHGSTKGVVALIIAGVFVGGYILDSR